MRATARRHHRRHARWARQAAVTMTGFATSVIACGCEAGIDRELDAAETPDGRPGRARAALRGVDRRRCEKQLQMRVGQCVLTCPGTACYAGHRRRGDASSSARRSAISATAGRSRSASAASAIWRIPVMDGEFVCEDDDRPHQGGGRRRQSADHGARPRWRRSRRRKRRSRRSPQVPDVIMPFPGGIVRSGSKVGSKYKALRRLDQRRLLPDAEGRASKAR